MSRLRGVRWLPHLPAPLAGCWYLDEHWDHDRNARTAVGNLVYRAKTYDGKPGVRSAADSLGELMQLGAELVRDKRQYPLSHVTVVVPVTAFPPKHPYNLPDVLGEHVASVLGVHCDPGLLIKEVATPPAKTASVDEVAASIRDAYSVTERLRGERVLLIDDLVRFGTTLGAIAGLLEGAGAESIGGFVATRARRGMTM